MFGSSFSPSWTYMVILFKNKQEGHKVIEFTLPSNQTEYANDNVNAYRYFVHNLLKDLGYAVLGVVSSEDYINIERVGISKELACKFALEREKKPHPFYSKEFFKILKDEENVEKSITIDQLRRYIQVNSRKEPVFNFTLNVTDNDSNSLIINFTHPDEASDFLMHIKKYHKEYGYITLGNIFNYLGIDAMAEDWICGWYNIEEMEIIDRMIMPNNQIYSIVFPSSVYIKYS